MCHRNLAFHRLVIEQKDDALYHDNVEDAVDHYDIEDAVDHDDVEDAVDSKNVNIVPTMTHAVTCIPKEEIAGSPSRGVSHLDYQRSGLKFWPLPPASYGTHSSVPNAFAKLNSNILPQKFLSDHSKMINDQLVIRTLRLPEADESYSPTPEGVHQDSTFISSVTLVGLEGVKSGGESRLWTLDQPTGNYRDSEVWMIGWQCT